MNNIDAKNMKKLLKKEIKKGYEVEYLYLKDNVAFYLNIVDTIVKYYKDPCIDHSFFELLEKHPEFSILFNRGYRSNIFRTSDIFFVWFGYVNRKDASDYRNFYVGASTIDASITENHIPTKFNLNPKNIHELFLLLLKYNKDKGNTYKFNIKPLEGVMINHTTDEVMGWYILYLVKKELESYDEINLKWFTDNIKTYYNMSDEGIRLRMDRVNGCQIPR